MSEPRITSSGLFRSGMRMRIGSGSGADGAPDLTSQNLGRLMDAMRAKYGSKAEFELRLVVKANGTFVEALRQNQRTLSKNARYQPGVGRSRLEQRDIRRQDAVALLVSKGLLTQEQAGLRSGQNVTQRYATSLKRGQHMAALSRTVLDLYGQGAQRVQGTSASQHRPRVSTHDTVHTNPRASVAVESGASERLMMEEMPSPIADWATARSDIKKMADPSTTTPTRQALARNLVDAIEHMVINGTDATELAWEARAALLQLSPQERQTLPLSLRMLAGAPKGLGSELAADESAKDKQNPLAQEAATEIHAVLRRVDCDVWPNATAQQMTLNILNNSRLVFAEELREGLRRMVNPANAVVMDPTVQLGLDASVPLFRQAAMAHFADPAEHRPMVAPLSVRNNGHWVSLIAHRNAQGEVAFTAVDTDAAGTSAAVPPWMSTAKQLLERDSAAPIDWAHVAVDLQSDGKLSNGCGPLTVDLIKRVADQAAAGVNARDVANGWAAQALRGLEHDALAAKWRLMALRGSLIDALAQQAAYGSGTLPDLKMLLPDGGGDLAVGQAKEEKQLSSRLLESGVSSLQREGSKALEALLLGQGSSQKDMK